MLSGLLACGRVADSGRQVDSVPNPDDPRAQLTGAGASFPYPLYARWFNEYAPTTNRRINYLSIGSSAGIEESSRSFWVAKRRENSCSPEEEHNERVNS
jgi:ABC-type phosphate transport system substrate-binding protein